MYGRTCAACTIHAQSYRRSRLKFFSCRTTVGRYKMPGKPVSDAAMTDQLQRSTNVPLVRVEGKTYRDGSCWEPKRLVANPTLLRDMRDTTAREAEARFGFPPSLYFYVGHACPTFASDGNTFVFVFAGNTFDDDEGSMTHFDTGGLYCGKVHLDSSVDPCDYLTMHRIESLATWRDEFERYVSTFFDSPAAYVLGQKPTKADAHGRHFHPENERRAWTWELQLSRDHDLRAGLKRLWLTTEAHDKLADAVTEIVDRQEKLRWRAILTACLAPPIATDDATSLCRAAEAEIASWL